MHSFVLYDLGTPWDTVVRMRTLVNRTMYDVLLHSSCVRSLVLNVRVLHDRVREHFGVVALLHSIVSTLLILYTCIP